MTYQDHANAVFGLLRADTGPPPLVVYPAESGQPGSADGTVPDGAEPPYVAVHIHRERPYEGNGAAGDGLNGATQRVVLYAYCHCVGADEIGARAVAQRVEAALLDARPTVAGRTVHPIRYDSGQPPRSDESTGTLVSELTDVYRLETLPA